MTQESAKKSYAMKTNNKCKGIWNPYIDGPERTKCSSMKKSLNKLYMGIQKNTEVEPYKSTSGDPITIKATVKDLGVFSTNDLLFKEHMGKTINSCKILIGMLLRT